MKTTLFAFLICTTLSFGQNYDQWKTYISEEGKISVSFPEEAIASVEGDGNDESPRTFKYQLEGDNYLYYATATNHESGLEEREEYLCQLSLDSFNETLGGTLKNQSVWKVQGEEGIAAKIQLADKQIVYYRVVMKGNIQYQLLMLGLEDTNLVADKADQFFKTFRITE